MPEAKTEQQAYGLVVKLDPTGSRYLILQTPNAERLALIGGRLLHYKLVHTVEVCRAPIPATQTTIMTVNKPFQRLVLHALRSFEYDVSSMPSVASIDDRVHYAKNTMVHVVDPEEEEPEEERAPVPHVTNGST